jgi:tetratricopeptide (TPR) repeat protein
MMDTPTASQEASKPATNRPTRRRGAGGVIVQAALLAGLAWLTYANATSSRALVEAVDAESRGDYSTALRAATEHLDHRPWSREASRIVARCLSRLDFAEQAEPYYRKGGDLSLSDLRYRAYGLTRCNLRERALLAFDEILARQADDIASLRLKAGLLISLSRPNDASEPPGRRVGPDSEMMIEVSRWHDVAEIGRRLSGFPRKSAEVDFPVTVGSHWTFRPREIGSVPTIGATLEALAAHNQGDTVGAVKAFERVRALDPSLRSMPLDHRLFWSLFGEDMLSMGRASDLIHLLESEEEVRSDSGLVALRARAHSQLGEVDQAEACWRRVLELSPDQVPAWLSLGRIELARGNGEEAARLLARAVALAPDSVDATYNLGLSYRKLGRTDEASKWEQEAARLLLRREEKLRKRHLPQPQSSITPPAP